MNIHKNAKLTPKGREEMVRRMQNQPAAVRHANSGEQGQVCCRQADAHTDPGNH
ncbi:MAG: hypothetical protein LBK01_01915 [Burkholderiaceae bacterium]|nr:hypothetical protein [Burkholderiaceae bacterium]